MKLSLKSEFICYKTEKLLRENGLHLNRKDCASILGVDYNTFGLYLRKNGTTFHKMKSKIRFEKVNLMLKESASDMEIEEALGFDGPGSLDAFLRRNKRMGMSTYKRINLAAN